MVELQFTPPENIPAIVQDLRQSFNIGLTKDLSFRKQQLANLISFCEEQTDAIVQALQKDLHKHRMETNVGEISAVVDECKYMIKNLDRLAKSIYTKKRFQMNAMDKTYIRKEPKGVVAVLGAWNYPINLLLLPVVGAIAAGCCIVIKPSEVSANTADLISRVLPQYLDKRTYTVVNGGVPETTALLEQRFGHIFYTGNGAVGKIVMTAAAKHLTPVTLELGGKSPAIVTPDADFNITAHRLLWGKFFNAGQTCVAPDYVLVSKEQTERLVVAFRNVIREYYSTNPQKSESYGRVVNTRQFDRLKAILEKLDPKSIVIGGETDRDELYIAPTVISPVSVNDAHIMQDEIFGPLLPIVPVKDMQEAIDVVNSKEQPLALYVFASSAQSYNNILNQTNSGGALVNDTLMHLQELSLPFGGVGPSGMGSYHGDKSFDTFTHERSTMIKSTAFESVIAARYPPYTEDKETVLNFLVFGFPSSVGGKIKTFFRACSASFRVLFHKQSNA
ncbi:Aldehyde/histidinol dehydrogenase [Zychaea mexicana]|uniref:Aldehyde/histidinol dehydrogenase n=1 Tax=Zychaea mexicana TaxID=64656 RepID=UPI0022FDC08F|nr:Aldehyde/histidinol dehydrogenase [Zychaea mexicana]KAI9499572.1 Aldehyde/histidinol dehydrogenase [Zychaea mexicana]